MSGRRGTGGPARRGTNPPGSLLAAFISSRTTTPTAPDEGPAEDGDSSTEPLTIDLAEVTGGPDAAAGGGASASASALDAVAAEAGAAATATDDFDAMVNGESDGEEGDVMIVDPPSESGLASGAQAAAFSSPSPGQPGQAQNRTPCSADDFKSPSTRKRPAEAMDSAEDSDDEESYTCPICFEPWSTSGRHRVISLKCGHLFGKLCIEKWLKGQGERCPTCNIKATKKDIRPIFVKVVKAVDTSGEESLRRELEEAVQDKRRAERAEAAARIQLQILKTTHERLKAEMLSTPAAAAPAQVADEAGPADPGPSDSDPRFILDNTVQLKQTDCRVLEYDSRHAMLLCSGEGLANPFARGAACGLVKVSALDSTRTEYIGIHHKAIRDIRSCPDNSGIVLTASLDRTAKLTNINSNAVVCTYKLDAPSWTCCWDKDRPTTLYVGLTTSHIMEFDTRNAAEPVRTLRTPVPKPLVALHHLSSADGFELRGLAACTLGGTSFYPRYVPLPALDGMATWSAPHPESQHCVSTLRPGRDRPRVQHIVSKLSPDGADGVACSVQGVMIGGTTQKSLSRSTLLSKPGAPDTLFLAASDEPTHTVKIWDVGSGGMLQSLSCQGLVCADVKSLRAGSRDVLAVLTDRRLLLHTWR